MKTYQVVLEKGKSEQEVIPTDQAFFYALFEDMKALVDEPIDEEKFLTFLDQECHQIEDALKEAWENWKQEQGEEEEEED